MIWEQADLKRVFFFPVAAAAAKLLQSCPTLCDPIDGGPPGSSVHGILQARALEWVAISSSSAWKWKVKVKSLSHIRLLVTPWTAVYHAPPSMGFSSQEYWSGVPFFPVSFPFFILHVSSFGLCFVQNRVCAYYQSMKGNANEHTLKANWQLQVI